MFLRMLLKDAAGLGVPTAQETTAMGGDPNYYSPYSLPNAPIPAKYVSGQNARSDPGFVAAELSRLSRKNQATRQWFDAHDVNAARMRYQDALLNAPMPGLPAAPVTSNPLASYTAATPVAPTIEHPSVAMPPPVAARLPGPANTAPAAAPNTFVGAPVAAFQRSAAPPVAPQSKPPTLAAALAQGGAYRPTPRAFGPAVPRSAPPAKPPTLRSSVFSSMPGPSGLFGANRTLGSW